MHQQSQIQSITQYLEKKLSKILKKDTCKTQFRKNWSILISKVTMKINILRQDSLQKCEKRRAKNLRFQS